MKTFMTFFALIIFNTLLADEIPPSNIGNIRYFKCPKISGNALTSNGYLTNDSKLLMPFSGSPDADYDKWVAVFASGGVTVTEDSVRKQHRLSA